MQKDWKTLKGKEIHLVDGRIVYEREDIINTANRLLGDIGYLEYYTLKTDQLSRYNKERISEAIFERFQLECDLCYKKKYDLIKMSDTQKDKKQNTNRDYYVCRECWRKMIDILEKEKGEIGAIDSLVGKKGNHIIPEELKICEGIFAD